MPQKSEFYAKVEVKLFLGTLLRHRGSVYKAPRMLNLGTRLALVLPCGGGGTAVLNEQEAWEASEPIFSLVLEIERTILGFPAVG